VKSVSLTFAPDSAVKASFTLAGKEEQLRKTTSFFTHPHKDNSCPANAFEAKILIDDEFVTCVTEMTLNIENQIDGKFVIGDKLSQKPSLGACEVSGSLTLFFENMHFYSKFKNGEKMKLRVGLDGNVPKRFVFFMDNVILTNGKTDVSDDGDVMATFDYRALPVEEWESSLLFSYVDDIDLDAELESILPSLGIQTKQTRKGLSPAKVVTSSDEPEEGAPESKGSK